MTASGRVQPVGSLLRHAGIFGKWDLARAFRRRQIRLNGRAARRDHLVKAGDFVSVGRLSLEARDLGGRGRLQLFAAGPLASGEVATPVRVHAGYHKCLTNYSKKVYHAATRSVVPFHPTFRHFFHREDVFYVLAPEYRISSISGYAVDLSRYTDIKIVRFLRDPRDMLVSGFFYHKRGAEDWTRLPDPNDVDWMVVNGRVPSNLPARMSLHQYLNDANIEDGLLAEIDFRANHFDSMMSWPSEDDRILLVRYEDIIGQEKQMFQEVLSFLGLPALSQAVGGYAAKRLSADNMRGKIKHIRDPRTAQWRQHFTDRVNDAFRDRFGTVLERYGYDQD